MLNWCYFPLEGGGQSGGVNYPLPDFTIQHGDPWSQDNGWFNGDGSETSIVQPWAAAPTQFEGVALPNDGSYLLCFQVELGGPPISSKTLFFCGFNRGGTTDGIRCFHSREGSLVFECRNRHGLRVNKSTGSADLSVGVKNIFCHVDQRPAGMGIDSVFVHTYQDGTDVKFTSFFGADLSALGPVYPQEIDSATALIIGADQANGAPIPGTHFIGKLRRLHLIRFGSSANGEPSNVAEFMGELSRSNLLPTNQVQQLLGVSTGAIRQKFVRYV